MPSQYEKVLIMGRRVKHIIEKAELSVHSSGQQQGHPPLVPQTAEMVTRPEADLDKIKYPTVGKVKPVTPFLTRALAG